MELLYDIINVGIYSILAIVMMILGNFLIDLIVPERWEMPLYASESWHAEIFSSNDTKLSI